MISRKEAMQRIKEFGLYHAIQDLPHSQLTVEAFELAVQTLQEQSQNKQPCNTCRHYNMSKKLYTDECQFCRRYYADQYEPKDN